jgi:hypothetical protein
MLLDFGLLFTIANFSILPVWLLLIFLPKHHVSRWLTDTYFIQMILALIYAFLIVDGMGRGGDGSFSSLEGVRKLFADDAALLAGWIHYLVFDSFVGTWMVRDAESKNIPHLHIIIPLVFTFLLGPIGFLLYVVYRAIYLKKAAQ